MTAEVTPEMRAAVDEAVMRVTTSQPAFIILRGVRGDQAAGPLEWVDGKVEHRFVMDKPNIISGFDVCHGDGTPIYHSDDMKKISKGESYTVCLAVGRTSNA